MSIINDALKKVQNDLANNSAGSNPSRMDKAPLPKKNLVLPPVQNTTSGSSTTTPKPPVYPPRVAPGENKNRVTPAEVTPAAQKPAPLPQKPKNPRRFLLLATALTILLLSFLTLRHEIRRYDQPLPAAQPQTVPVSVIPPVANLADPPPEPSAPAPETPKDPVVSGIMTMNNRQVALINNDIYEVGNAIGDMKIVAITLDQVDVEENGQKRSLKVYRKP